MTRFRIDVVVNPGKAVQGSKKVEGGLKRVENRADSLRSSLRRAIGIIGGGVLITNAVRTLAKFEESLATVRAVSGATADQFEKLREKAQELGITTRFTATQAGDALLNLSRAGFSVEESLEAVSGTLLLAQAGGLGLAEAANITTTALKGFRLEADQTGRAVDVLTLTANSTNTTVQQLGEGLKLVAPIAAGLGVSLEETNAALGTLSNAGLKATLAGTGLRRVLGELEAPSSKSVAILEQLSLTADDVKVSQVGLSAALQLLADRGVTTAQALELFGQRGGPAFEVLNKGVGSVTALTAALNGAKGTAAQTAATIDNSLNGAILRAKSAFEGLTIAIGNAGATSILRDSFEGFAIILQFLARNADATAAALVVLSVVLISKFVPAAVAARAAAIAVHPVMIAITLAITAFTIVMREAGATARKAAEDFKKLQDTTALGALDASIRSVSQSVATLSLVIQKQGFASQGQASRLFDLKNRLIELKDQQQKNIDTEKQLAEARERAKPSIENSLEALDKRIALTKLSTRESEIELKVQQEVDKLLAAKQGVTPDDRAAIESRLRLIQASEDQRKALEDIKGPQEEQNRLIAAHKANLESGRITVEEYNAALAALKQTNDDLGNNDPFKTQVTSLKDSIALLQARLVYGKLGEDLLRKQIELRNQGGKITEDGTRKLIDLLVIEEHLTEELRKQNEARNAKTADARRLQSLRDELDVQGKIRQEREQLIRLANDPVLSEGLDDEIAKRFDELNRRAQEAAGGVATDTSAKLEELRIQAEESSFALGDGFSRAFRKIKEESQNLAAVGEAIVNTFADKATDALINFTETGKFAFREFASDLLSQIAKIIARLLIMQAITAATGGGGSLFGLGAAAAGGGGGGQGFADGGTTQPNRSFMVGERGPELFTPGQTGSVAPIAGVSAAAEPPQVNVQVVNVSDPNEVGDAIDSGDFDDQIINALARNKDKAKQVIT
tara:strand:- start:5702 stop:8608 length:2907 start_codon:yes stop_codon:yes gene_type:complete